MNFLEMMKLKNKNIVSTNFNKNRFTNFLLFYD